MCPAGEGGLRNNLQGVVVAAEVAAMGWACVLQLISTQRGRRRAFDAYQFTKFCVGQRDDGSLVLEAQGGQSRGRSRNGWDP